MYYRIVVVLGSGGYNTKSEALPFLPIFLLFPSRSVLSFPLPPRLCGSQPIYVGTECICVVTAWGHPRLLIMVPIEIAYATSYSCSVAASVLCGTVSGKFKVFCGKQPPSPIPCESWGYFSWTRLPIRGAKYIRHPTRQRYLDVTTNGRTDIIIA